MFVLDDNQFIFFSLLIGFLTGAFNPSGVEKMQPFTGNLFYGVECFFLLDMGIVALQRLPGLKRAGSFLIAFAVLMPVFNALINIFITTDKNILKGAINIIDELTIIIK